MQALAPVMICVEHQHQHRRQQPQQLLLLQQWQ
jgi:hypothetical protein